MIVFALYETATTDSKATPSYTVLSKQDSEVLLQPEDSRSRKSNCKHVSYRVFAFIECDAMNSAPDKFQSTETVSANSPRAATKDTPADTQLYFRLRSMRGDSFDHN
jgi:hypothetical protein